MEMLFRARGNSGESSFKLLRVVLFRGRFDSSRKGFGEEEDDENPCHSAENYEEPLWCTPSEALSEKTTNDW